MQFGIKETLTLIMELCIRGLTKDMNEYDEAKRTGNKDELKALQDRLAFIFEFLANLFYDNHLFAR